MAKLQMPKRGWVCKHGRNITNSPGCPDCQTEMLATPRPEMGKAQLFADFEKHYAAIPYKGGTKEVLFHDWMYEKLLEFYAAASGTESAPEIVLLDFGKSPCGHPGQYAYTEDAGKNIICLLCERASSLTQAGPTAKEFWKIYYQADPDFPPSSSACTFAEAYFEHRAAQSQKGGGE